MPQPTTGYLETVGPLQDEFARQLGHGLMAGLQMRQQRETTEAQRRFAMEQQARSRAFALEQQERGFTHAEQMVQAAREYEEPYRLFDVARQLETEPMLPHVGPAAREAAQARTAERGTGLLPKLRAAAAAVRVPTLTPPKPPALEDFRKTEAYAREQWHQRALDRANRLTAARIGAGGGDLSLQLRFAKLVEDEGKKEIADITLRRKRADAILKEGIDDFDRRAQTGVIEEDGDELEARRRAEIERLAGDAWTLLGERPMSTDQSVAEQLRARLAEPYDLTGVDVRATQRVLERLRRGPKENGGKTTKVEVRAPTVQEAVTAVEQLSGTGPATEEDIDAWVIEQFTPEAVAANRAARKAGDQAAAVTWQQWRALARMAINNTRKGR